MDTRDGMDGWRGYMRVLLIFYCILSTYTDSSVPFFSFLLVCFVWSVRRCFRLSALLLTTYLSIHRLTHLHIYMLTTA